MIVTETERGWRCITQPDHAHLSHDILAFILRVKHTLGSQVG